MTTRLSVDEAFARHVSLAGDRGGAPAIELLDGLLVRRGLPSAAVVAAVVELASDLDRRAHGLEVDVRGALACPPHDVLRPEVTVRRVLPPHRRRPAPGPESVVVAVLIADDERETAWRARRCAAVGVGEVWTIVAGADHGTRLRAPRGGVYTVRELLLPGERVAPEAAPWLGVVALRATSTPP
jgi:hypothetical protein